ncbi:MAG: ABC transporter ATP-binding protein [Anaerolineales bacterium]|nr:ABC transporter ATP-binding protein [Anaerolineales bacterium]
MIEIRQEILLSVRGITKDFGGLRALDAIDLDVMEGCIVALIGPNGSGKTTLFNLITGMFLPTSGNVSFSGKNITGFPPHSICRSGIARTFQQIRLFRKMSVLENVMAGAVARANRPAHWLKGALASHGMQARELLEYVGLGGKEALHAGALPYGDQRRLEVARALATGPRLLLLDEPLAGMNQSEIVDFCQLVRQINESGITIFLIEHNVRVIMSTCNPIYVFDHGRKIAEGKARDLQNNKAVIKAYLGEEMEQC